MDYRGSSDKRLVAVLLAEVDEGLQVAETLNAWVISTSLDDRGENFFHHLPRNAVSDGKIERPIIRHSLKPLQTVAGGSRFDPIFHRLAPQYEQRAESEPHTKGN